MKRIQLACLLAIAMIFSSFDGTAMAVSGADLSSEPLTEEISVETEEDAGAVDDETVVLSEDEEETAVDAGSEVEVQAEAESTEADFDDGMLEEIIVAKVNMENVRTKFYSGMENVYLDRCSIEVSYGNGEEETIVLDGTSDMKDSYGNRFGYGFGEQDGSYVYPMGSALSDGTYDLIFTANGEKLDVGADYTITVGKMDSSELRELKPGVNKIIYSPDNSFAWYCFTPKYTGDYIIEPSEEMVIYYENTVYNWMDQVKGEYESGRWSYVLSAGVTYYIGLRGSIYDYNTGPGNRWNYFDMMIINSECEFEHTMGSWKTTSEPTVLKEGRRERTCKICGEKETTRIAKLKPTIRLNPAIGKTIPLKVKQSFLAKATGLAKGDKVVSWTSNSTRIATVSRTGTVVGKKAGTATITVKLQSGLKASFKVKVQKTDVATTSLRVVNKATGKTFKSATLKVKKTLTLVSTVAPVTSKQKVTYTSSNKKVATVNARGVITARKKGKTTITVKSGKKAVRIQITVK